MADVSKIEVGSSLYNIKDTIARDNSSTVSVLSNKITELMNEVEQLKEQIEAISQSSVESVNGKTGNVQLTYSDVNATPETHINKVATDEEIGHVKISSNEIDIENLPTTGSDTAASIYTTQQMGKILNDKIKAFSDGDSGCIKSVNGVKPLEGTGGSIELMAKDINYKNNNTIKDGIEQLEEQIKDINIIPNPSYEPETETYKLTDLQIGEDIYRIEGGGSGGSNVEANPKGDIEDTLTTIKIDDIIYDIDNNVEANPEEESTDTLTSIKIEDIVYDIKYTNIQPNGTDTASESLKKIKINDTTYSIDGGVTSVTVGKGEKQTGDVIITLPEEKNEIAIGKEETKVLPEIQLFIDESENYGSGTDSSGESSKHKYSTEEKIVGEWVDGSPVYEKTIHISNINLSYDSSNQIYYYMTDDNIISEKCKLVLSMVNGKCYDTLNKGFLQLPFLKASNTCIYVSCSKQIRFETKANYSNRLSDIDITVQYLKEE